MNTVRAPHSFAFLVPLFVLFFSSASAQNADTKAWNQSYHHNGTDLLLPKHIAGFELVELSAFGGGDYQGDDVGVRFVDDLTKIDVYLTKVGDLPVVPDDPLAAHTNGIRQVISAIKTVTERGLYHDLEVGDSASVSKFEGDGNEKLAMVEMNLSYRQTDTGQAQSDLGNVKRESSIAITFYRGYQVKVRHTFPIAGDEEVLNLRREKRDRFHSNLRSLITDVSMRTKVKKAIAKLKENPGDTDSAGLLVNYAEASKLVSIGISPGVLPFLKDESFKASPELLAAFIAGNIEGQLSDEIFEDHPVSGAMTMLNAYEKLKAAGSCNANEDLDTLLQFREAGTLEAEIQKLIAKEQE